jgi:hypothetical protein
MYRAYVQKYVSAMLYQKRVLCTILTNHAREIDHYMIVQYSYVCDDRVSLKIRVSLKARLVL